MWFQVAGDAPNFLTSGEFNCRGVVVRSIFSKTCFRVDLYYIERYLKVRCPLLKLATVWPSPKSLYLYVVSPSRPTGARACNFPVLTPSSAPRPYRKPSEKRVEAF